MSLQDKENKAKAAQIVSISQFPNEESKYANILTETTVKLENALVLKPENLDPRAGVQKRLNFTNCTKEEEEEEEKPIQIQRYLFGTDLWFTGLGMGINELCDPKDEIIKEGELYRYKPGLDRVYISRWCQLTTKVFRVYKNQM